MILTLTMWSLVGHLVSGHEIGIPITQCRLTHDNCDNADTGVRAANTLSAMLMKKMKTMMTNKLSSTPTVAMMM